MPPKPVVFAKVSFGNERPNAKRAQNDMAVEEEPG
jgi:hypothetical protein